MYYKIIKDGVVIDAVMGSPWVCKGKHGRPVRCDPRHATGVLSSDSSLIYHIDGAAPLGEYQDVIVADITAEEYEALLPELALGETVPAMPVAEEPSSPSVLQEASPAPVMSAAQLRQHILEQDKQISQLTEMVNQLLRAGKEGRDYEQNTRK